jgi:hypothetical protein
VHEHGLELLREMESEQKFKTKKPVIGGSDKSYADDIHNLYLSPNVTVVNKSRRKRLARRTAFIYERYVQDFYFDNIYRADEFGDFGINLKTILIWILGKQELR